MVNFTILLNAKLLKSTMHTGVGGRGRRGWGVGWGGIKQYSAQHLFSRCTYLEIKLLSLKLD